MVMVYGVTGERRVERVGNFFLKRLRSQRGVPFFLRLVYGVMCSYSSSIVDSHNVRFCWNRK